MAKTRIAVASTPLATTLEEATPAAIAAVREAGRLGARIVCLPETGLPGHRCQARSVPRVTKEALEASLEAIAAAAREAKVVTIVGAERPTARGLEIVSEVIDADGTRLGAQVKTQIDPSEDPHYVPGSGRRVFTAGGVTFGIVICHEAFRYPELSRALVLHGAQVLFVPHYVTTADGWLPVRWCDASNPYNEKALVCRALENTVFVAASNFAGADQGSITGLISPQGALLAKVDYGKVGVVAADLELSEATGLIAQRWAPERNELQAKPGG